MSKSTISTFTGRFALLSNEWRVVVNTGTPQIGDEIRVRKADKSVVVMFVSALAGAYDGHAVCRVTERRTISGASTVSLQGEIRPAEMLAALPRSAGAARARRMIEREERTGHEIRHQIGF